MCKLKVQGIGFLSFMKLCSLLSVHFALILAALFMATNGGRRVNFGSYYFYGTEADLFGSLFLFLFVNLLVTVLGVLSCYPANLLLRCVGGLRMTLVIDDASSR